jgi:Holliday junction DNA helicase RuvA
LIAHLAGRLLEKGPQNVIVDVAGVGYRLMIPVSTFYRLGDEGSEVRLRVHTHVREDALQLFGFGSAREQRLFEKLIAVSGVGPRLALAILSGIEPPELVKALMSGDVVRLNRIPGVGKKTAERLVLELKDKVQPEADDPADATPPPEAEPGPGDDLVLALLHLGYSRPDAERGAERALREGPDDRFEDLLRRALRQLSGGRR